MQTSGNSFPTTNWGLFDEIRGRNQAAKQAALDVLIRRYWKPVFQYLKYNGAETEPAKDATQSFFADWIERDAFAKADERKGRFRSFMLTCLKRFVSNIRRADQARKRAPTQGLVSLDALMEDESMPFEPSGGMSPDAIFDRTWATEVVLRVLAHLEREFEQTRKSAHFDIFKQRIMLPILEGRLEPPLADLASLHGVTEKQAANHLLTAKRAYRRLLEEEIRLYADSETEVAQEIRALFLILGD